MKKLFFLFSFFYSIVCAQTPLNYLTSTEGGSAYEVFFYNDYLFVGCANTLEVYDLSGPGNTPGVLLWKKRMLSNIDYITEHNGKIYVCANHDGLYKFSDHLPDSLHQEAHYTPASINESIYDVEFYGSDTLIVAAKHKLNIMTETTNSFNFESTIHAVSGTSRIHGLDIKNNLLVYSVGFTNAGTDGVYLFDLNAMTQRDVYYSDYSDIWDVEFGQNNDLIHVLGGKIVNTSDSGYYYVLSYGNPTNLTLKFADSIDCDIGFAAPMNAVIVNDTIYVSTQAGENLGGGPVNGNIYVYDATDTNNVHFVDEMYAGLYHFDSDIDLATRTMYIASEWYGIWTLDITDVHNEIVKPKKRTGGWCHGSAQVANIFVEASEGYGIQLYNVDTIDRPHLMAADTSTGFCRSVSIHDNGQYIFGWFLTLNNFRVYDQNLNLQYGTTINQLPEDFQKSRYFNNRVAVIQQPLFPLLLQPRRIVVANVTNPVAPTFLYKNHPIALFSQLCDISWHSSGKLFGVSEDSLFVLDTLMNVLTTVKRTPGYSFKAITISNDTVFVFSKHVFGTTDSLMRFHFNSSTNTLNRLSVAAYPMNSTSRIFMANDSGLIYIASTIDGLTAISKSDYSMVDYYNHGADHVYDHLWGVQDLYYTNGHLFLNEYMGQTSIFGAPSPLTGIEETGSQQWLKIYPNPATDYFSVQLPENVESLITIYSIEGKLMYVATLETDQIKLSTFAWEPGTYLVTVQQNARTYSAKLIVNK